MPDPKSEPSRLAGNPHVGVQMPPMPAGFGNVEMPAIAAMQVVAQQTSGPIPNPAVLAAYGQIDPGFPARILAMAEQNAATERLTSQREQTFELAESVVSRLIALLFAGGALVVVLILALRGHDAVAGILAGTTLASVAAAFIVSRHWN